MASSAAFQRLIRFVDSNGKEYYGDLGAEAQADQIHGKPVPVLTGSLAEGFKPTSEEKTVAKV